MRKCVECGKESDEPGEVFAGLCRECLDKKVTGKPEGQAVIVPQSELGREIEPVSSLHSIPEPRTLSQKVLKRLGRWP